MRSNGTPPLRLRLRLYVKTHRHACGNFWSSSTTSIPLDTTQILRGVCPTLCILLHKERNIDFFPFGT
jgi:hypothetical protein